MPRFRLTLDLSNAAFDGECRGPEIARILREVADQVESNGAPTGSGRSLRDINGNNVGDYDLTR